MGQIVKLGRSQGLGTVAEGMGGIIVDFDHQTVRTCGDGGGYLPTEKAEQGSHYSAYISSGQVGHEGGDMMVRKDIDVINKMFKE